MNANTDHAHIAGIPLRQQLIEAAEATQHPLHRCLVAPMLDAMLDVLEAQADYWDPGDTLDAGPYPPDVVRLVAELR